MTTPSKTTTIAMMIRVRRICYQPEQTHPLFPFGLAVCPAGHETLAHVGAGVGANFITVGELPSSHTQLLLCPVTGFPVEHVIIAAQLPAAAPEGGFGFDLMVQPLPPSYVPGRPAEVHWAPLGG